MGAIASHARGATIALQVQPRGTKTEIIDSTENYVRMRVTAPPVEGAANAAIVTWLSKQLKVPKMRVEILSGNSGRRKVVLVTDVTVKELETALRLT